MGFPVNLLINGKGTFLESGNNGSVTTPTKVFKIASGVRLGFKYLDSLNLEWFWNIFERFK